MPASEIVFKGNQQRSKLENSTNELVARSLDSLRRRCWLTATTELGGGGGGDALRGALCKECARPLCLLNASKTLPRYRIFYNAKYEKAIGLPRKHALRRVRHVDR